MDTIIERLKEFTTSEISFEQLIRLFHTITKLNVDQLTALSQAYELYYSLLPGKESDLPREKVIVMHKFERAMYARMKDLGEWNSWERQHFLRASKRFSLWDDGKLKLY